MSCRARWLLLLAVVAACQAPRSDAPPGPPPGSGAAPANVSHGEAPVGTDTVAPVAAAAPPRGTQRRHRVRLEITHNRVLVAPGTAYDAWTFGGTVPGPVIRVTVGDTVDFTLVNRSPMPHSMDFHAAEVAPSRVYVNLMPNDSLQYQWTANVAGAFMYHCGTAPVAMHIANGMYGALIVDPVRPRAPAREFVLVQSEFYLQPASPADSGASLNWDKLLSQAPDYVVFNGRATQYADSPVRVWVNEPLRFYVVDAGPNRISSFHVVGAIFTRVYLDGSDRYLEGVQTANVPVGGGLIFEARLREAGTYPFVTHAFADATKGAVGMLEAVDRVTGGR